MPALIFDLDDTLYPHVRFVHSGFSAVARHVQERFGCHATDVYRRLRAAREQGCAGCEFQIMCRDYQLADDIVPQLVEVYRTHTPQLWLWHDVAPALRALRAWPWPTAVLTNGVPAVQAAKVTALGLSPLVDHVVFAGEHAEGGKPAREPFHEALRRLRTPPGETVMVGDDPVRDIDGGRAAGLHTILIARHGRPGAERADAVLPGLAEVPQVAAELVRRGRVHAA